LLLLHGANGSLHAWEGWARALAKQARVITVDLPSHGLAGAWPRGEYMVGAYADFVEMLARTLNLDRFVLGGHSLGGAVAWSFAATRPGRVATCAYAVVSRPRAAQVSRRADADLVG
jgi:pimeloyl-ACP methyl ester carboxylesterase